MILQVNISHNCIDEDDDTFANAAKIKSGNLKPEFLEFDHLEIDKPVMTRRFTKRKQLKKFDI